MRLIGVYEDPGYLALADAAMAFFDRRTDLQRASAAEGMLSQGPQGLDRGTG